MRSTLALRLIICGIATGGIGAQANVQSDLYRSPNDKGSFLSLEVWRNLAALEEHKQTPPLWASFERRKSKGWTTEITTWKRVDNAAK